jgi:transposase
MAMTSLAEPSCVVTVGVDTHRDFNVAAALEARGGVLDTATFASTAAGHEALLVWARGFGPIDAAGVEGTSSWGAGLARHLSAAGVRVLEVNRPNRAERRRSGKSDDLDAIAAARAVQSGEATAAAKTKNGPVEAIRALRVARKSAIKARTQAANQLHGLVATAPEELRAQLRDLTAHQLADRCARSRPTDPSGALGGTRTALRSIARRYQKLTTEIAELDATLKPLVADAAPGLVAMIGIGTDIAGQLLVTAGDNPDRLAHEPSFARLCGVAPIPASSGLTTKHRLHRGGDRQANAALHRAVIVRLHCHPPTRAYVKKRMAQGRTKKDAIRSLKRYLARQVHAELTRPRLDAI